MIIWWGMFGESIDLEWFTAFTTLIATAIGGLYVFAHATDSPSGIFANSTDHWVKAFYACSLSCNTLATGSLKSLKAMFIHMVTIIP
jgi:hypothetical protein